MKNKSKRPTLNKKYPGGGTFKSYIGDYGRLMADTTLSEFGLSNVIQDDAYKNSSMKNASKVTSGIAGAALPIAGTILGGPAGGLVGNSIKQGIGSMNPQSTSNPNKYDQFGNLIGNTTQVATPFIGKNGGIYIKPSKRGTFTAAASKHGKSVQGFASQVLANKENYSPAMVKKANFAKNASKWHHEMGGVQNLYPNGGMSITNDNNAEIEKQEVMRAPNGSTMQVDGNSHNQGGVPVNIPNGTQIYSDRLKDPETKKTFAKLAEKYKVHKEEKILDDNKSTSIARRTAELNMNLKQQRLSEIFNKQEQLKHSKVNEYAKKLGVTLPQPSANENQEFAYGGVKQYPGGGYLGQDPELQGNYSNIQGTPETSYVSPNDGTNSGLSYSSSQGTFTPEGEKTANPYGQNISTGYKPSLTDIGMAAANIAGPVYNLATNKRPQPFEYALPQMQKYDPSAELAEADRQNATARFLAKQNAGGNSAAYLATLPQLQSAMSYNKQDVINRANNYNVGTFNQMQIPTTQIKNEQINANQANMARYRDINRAAVSNLGTNVAGTMRDYKAGNMDRNTANLISNMFSNYKLDMNNPNDWQWVLKNIK